MRIVAWIVIGCCGAWLNPFPPFNLPIALMVLASCYLWDTRKAKRDQIGGAWGRIGC